MNNHYRPKHLILLMLPFVMQFFFISCDDAGRPDDNGYSENMDIPWVHEGITELRRGDILIRANSNFLPGSAPVEDGWDHGHAAIVTKGSFGLVADSLLAKSFIFESNSRDFPREYQLRETRGYDVNSNPFLRNESFSPRYEGARYRLRLNLPEEQIESIIEFIIGQRGSYSSWNAMKRYPGNPEIEQMVQEGLRENWADNTHWYCSLIIWQAVLYVTGIDLDPTGGYYVYPNDLVASKHFDNTESHRGRARF